jgi:asparagine synthase (glutamine-hydrolysing)
MCGIAGYIGTNPLSEDRIHATLNRMKQRGPDDQSFLVIPQGDITVALLHARLSIIDLADRSNQPFTIGDVMLLFNGEIYNYVELRQQLEAQGVRFTTDSDTEVLLQAYLTYGESCVEHFEGMWAFAIYDRRAGKLILSRDRFGEKPLYFYQTEDGFYFGSEVKFIQSLSEQQLVINERQVLRYLVNGYKSLYKGKETFFRDIREVGAGCQVVIRPDLQAESTRYWSPRYQPTAMSLEDAIAGVKHHLMESVKIRLRSDVPLAFCLSGGVDSSALTSIAAKVFNYDVAAFSILDSDERYNEYGNIRATLDDLGCKSTIIELSSENTLQHLEALVTYHDAPVYTITYLIHSYLSSAISERGYRVAISGTSADELFTGYYDHFNLYLYEMRNNPNYPRYLDEWRTGIGQVVRNPHLQNPELFFDQPNFRDHIYLNNDVFRSYLTCEFDEAFYETTFTDQSLLRNRMLNELFHEATPVILHEDDLNSMCYSIENRSPYLDRRLFEFAYSIPTEHLIQDGYGKYTLRAAMDGILNDQVRLDRQKKGFNASINTLLDLSDPNTIEYLLADSPIFGLVDRAKIDGFLQQEGALSNSFSKFLFSFLSAKMFMDQHA